MYIILKIETHRDRIVDMAIGPFDTWDEARDEADHLYKSPFNRTSDGGRFYNFTVHELEPPA